MTGELQPSVRRALAALPGLNVVDDDRTRVEAVLNLGGFVHTSFRVVSRGTAYHVKLADNPEDLRGLRRWQRVGARLVDRYGAPPMVGWIDLRSHGLSGPVLTWLEGRSPSRLEGPTRSAAVDVVRALHADRDLAEALEQDGGPAGSCKEAYRSTYHRRFIADLDAVRASPPPFVTEERLGWMESEVARILARVEASSAFDAAADRATHQDLWLNNLIVQPDGALRIIDWDGLALGDPMLDWTMLLGPAPGSFRTAEAGDLPHGVSSRSERVRVDVLARASLLDWVIDPLADWIEAPESRNRDDVRRAKRGVHEGALAAYLERRWGH